MSEKKQQNYEESQSDIENKWFSKFPSAWDISKIEPQLHIYGKNKERVIITHRITGEEMVSELIKSGLLPTSRFIFITHGYKSDVNTSWLHTMKDEIIAYDGEQTVAIVGWGKGAEPGYWGQIDNYTQAAANSLAVGKWVAKYATALNDYFTTTDNTDKKSVSRSIVDILSLIPIIGKITAPFQSITRKSTIWGIGHSLGAHLFGESGREYGVFARFTGLDPAGPGFQTANHDKRLHKHDAPLVDVIHTDGNGFTYFGTLVPLGAIDFYPSYGWSQPTKSAPFDKPDSDLKFIKEPTEDEYYVRGYLTVSHSRAIDYFIWSIANRGKFTTNLKLDGTPDVEKAVHILKYCNHSSEMGYHTDTVSGSLASSGHYYVHPNPSEPWL